MKRSDRKLLIVGGLAVTAGLIYLFVSKKSTTTTTTTTNNNQIPAGNDGIVPKDQTPVDQAVVDYNTNIPVYTTPATPALILAMSEQGQNYYRSLVQFIKDPKYIAAFGKMTENELYYSWWYWANYLSHNIVLLKTTAKLPNGSWDNSNPGNEVLFNAINAIHAKYGIF